MKIKPELGKTENIRHIWTWS